MATTLSKGYKKPSTGDRGSVFYPAMEDNIQRMNDHTHNGVDGEKINAKYVVKTTVALPTGASWVAVAGQHGTYRQLVTLPVGFLEVKDAEKRFFDSSGTELTLDVERVSATTFYVYINDNTETVTVVYG